MVVGLSFGFSADLSRGLDANKPDAGSFSSGLELYFDSTFFSAGFSSVLPPNTVPVVAGLDSCLAPKTGKVD